jgi:hypothetical protein
MNQDRDSRPQAGLILLLVYQGILVLVSLGYAVGAIVGLLDIMSRPFDPADVVAVSCAIMVLAGWAALMIFASLGIVRRSPRGFFLGMIGHLLLAIPSLMAFVGLGFMFIFGAASANKETRAWAPLFLIFALMWLPTALLSGWAFYYLRRLRASFLTAVDGPPLS